MISAAADNLALLAQPAHLAASRFHLLARKLADELTFGTDPSRFVGSGIDFAQSRPMQLGDSVRSIDWRVTARTGRLHVKDYEAAKRLGVYIIVDTSASMAAASSRVSKHDIAVWTTAVLAQLALNRRSPVAVISGSDRAILSRPTSSRAMVTRWIETLRTRGWNERTRLTDAVRSVEALSMNRAIVAVVSDLYDPSAPDAIKRLAQRHDVIVLRPRDRAEEGVLRAGFIRATEAEDPAAEFVATSRARWFADDASSTADGTSAGFVGSGIDYAELWTDRPLGPVLARVLSPKRGPARVAR